MDEEIDAIECNNTWELSDPSKGGQPIDMNLVKKKLAKEKIKLTARRVENKHTTMSHP